MLRLYKAFFYSTAGILWALKNEKAFQQEFILLIIGILVNIWMKIPLIWHFLSIVSILLLIIIELLNTSVEKTLDRISKDFHPLTKVAKDLGSAAVFFGIIILILTWGICLYIMIIS